MGLYLACTIGCTLLLDHFWLLRPPVPPVLLGCSWRTARAGGETEPIRRAEANIRWLLLLTLTLRKTIKHLRKTIKN